MYRRDVLRLSLILPTAVAPAIAAKPAYAQFGDVTVEMIETRPWLKIDEFALLRRLAATLIQLRISYNGPNGYEAEQRFAAGAFNIWRQSLGANAVEGHQVAITKVQTALMDRNVSEILKEEMDKLLEANGKKFVEWLADIGIQRESRLQTDFVRAQALFAVTASVLLEDGRPSAFSNFTWVFPFC